MLFASYVMAVHPRVRGDDPWARNRRRCPFGSPPRAWGRSELAEIGVAVRRFTPACVGTIARSTWTWSRCPVHPRVRGDDRVREKLSASTVGSPPRAWGRFPLGRGGQFQPRFTPACVGTMACMRAAVTYGSVHPRVRGDDREGNIPCRSEVGSPPRAWGRFSFNLGLSRGIRFTPACVGTMARPRLRERHTPVHPRVRGDDASIHDTRCAITGSPPRAWGRY